MSGRVRIGTCANPADAAFVRSMFAARGIEVVIAAEHHASLLGALGSGFLSLDISVAEADAEEAVALLRDLRGEAGDGAGSGADGGQAGGDADGGDAHATEASSDDDNDGEDLQARMYRRRRTGLAILLGACITFGTAHMVAGAWLRGFALAALEIFGIRTLILGDRLGTAIVIATIVADLVGALWRLHTAARTALPIARIRRS